MNTITHEGNEYEVLSLDPESIKQITHARLAGGKVVVAQYQTEFCVGVMIESPEPDTQGNTFSESELEPFGIQPLKLLEKVPVEFVGEVSRIDGGNYYVDTINVPVTAKPGMKFRCTQIVEVTKRASTRSWLNCAGIRIPQTI